MVDIPTWCEPSSPEMWKTRPLKDDAMRYSLAIPADWAEAPQVRTTKLETEHQYTGRTPGENLFINLMPNADPQADITNWANAIIRIMGFPVVAMVGDPRPELLRWDAVPAPSTLAEQWNVDELHLFEGMAKMPGLIRIYMLLARRATTAWKITLTLDSACPPGTVPEIVERSDHVRAGATFGALRLL